MLQELKDIWPAYIYILGITLWLINIVATWDHTGNTEAGNVVYIKESSKRFFHKFIIHAICFSILFPLTYNVKEIFIYIMISLFAYLILYVFLSEVGCRLFKLDCELSILKSDYKSDKENNLNQVEQERDNKIEKT